MTPGTKAIKLQLGVHFRYAGIRVLPGSWNGWHNLFASEIVSSSEPVKKYLKGIYHLLDTTASDEMIAKNIETLLVQSEISLVPGLPGIYRLLSGHTVQQVARESGYSTRQLSRIMREKTGFSPRELIRIGKIQRVIQNVQSTEYLNNYYDQPHYIREFKRISGYTPSEFKKLF